MRLITVLVVLSKLTGFKCRKSTLMQEAENDRIAMQVSVTKTKKGPNFLKCIRGNLGNEKLSSI